MTTSLFISADIEGTCGTVAPYQCVISDSDSSAYYRAVEQLALEIETVCNTAFEVGVDRIVVNDAHHCMTNLRLNQLDPRVSLVTGKPKSCAMLSGLDEIFSGVILLGYHARAGTRDAVLSHTFHDDIFELTLNGVPYGEGGLNALYAQVVFGCPTLLTSGDKAYCKEMDAHSGGAILTVETKVGLSERAAICHPWQQVKGSYETAVRQALKPRPEGQEGFYLTYPSTPYTMQITFTSACSADRACLNPTFKRIDGRTIAFTHENFKTLYQMLQACYSMI
ncbi:MAG: M55 family metallopeptidase [Cyanobacteria bacterium P01_H01_bin.74]